MPISDIEVVFKCKNLKELDPAGEGICKGMVMLFILAISEMVDDRDWFPDLRCGAFIDPTEKGGFYITAATLQIKGQAMAQELRARIDNPDLNEMALVPTMYQQRGLEAVALWPNYVGGRGEVLAAKLRDAKFDWFHISLRSARGGHSIAVWRCSADVYLLIDPNFGAVQFMTWERFRDILVEEFKAEVDDEGSGQYADYHRMCGWGIEIDAGALPPPPPPPPRH
jgi:hypothetical protein